MSDWIEWNGGENPAGDKLVYVRLRNTGAVTVSSTAWSTTRTSNGVESDSAEQANHYDWGHWGHSEHDHDIIAYKYAEEKQMTDNSWYEKGELPPVGTVVQYIYDGKNVDDGTCLKYWKYGDKLEVLALRKVEGKLLPVVFNLRDETASCLLIECIGPIKSDREKAIEEMKRIAGLPAAGFDSTVCYGALYDAGYRKADK